MVIPVVIGALGAVSKSFETHIKKIGVAVKARSYPECNIFEDSSKESIVSEKALLEIFGDLLLPVFR